MTITEFFDSDTISLSRLKNNETLEIIQWEATAYQNQELSIQLYFKDKFEISFSDEDSLQLDIL